MDKMSRISFMMFAQEGKPSRGLEGEETAALPAGRHFHCHLLCHPALRPRPPRSSELRENGRQGPHLPPSDLKNGLKPITEMSRSRGHSDSKLRHSMAEMNAAICEMRSSEFPRFRRRGPRAHVVRGRIDRPIQSEARSLPRASCHFGGNSYWGGRSAQQREGAREPPLLPNSIHTFLNPVAAAANAATSGMPDRFHGHGQQARAAAAVPGGSGLPNGAAGRIPTGSFMCLRYS